MDYEYGRSAAPIPESCFFHPGVPAWVSCSRCGKPTCSECTFVMDIGQRCPECISRREIRPAGVRTRTRAFFPRPAVATPALIAACVAVFLFDSLTGRRIASFGMSQPYLVYGAGEWWRIGTAIFLHAGLLHLVFNMYALYIVGSILEEAWGAAKLAAAFIFSGIFASLVSATVPLLVKPLAEAARSPGSVGASGAIFGLFGALGVALYRRRHSPWARSNLTQIAVIVVINLVIGFAVPGIDNLAHLGGLASGLVIGAGFDIGVTRHRAGPIVLSLLIVGGAASMLAVAGRLAILS